MESGVQPQPVGLSPEDRDALEAYVDEIVSQCLDRDWDPLVERLTDDVVLLPPDEPAVIGKEAVADFLEAYPIMTAFSFPIEDADGRADHAATRGSFDMTVETEDGETRMVGKWLATYRKEGGGAGAWPRNAGTWTPPRRADSPPRKSAQHDWRGQGSS